MGIPRTSRNWLVCLLADNILLFIAMKREAWKGGARTNRHIVTRFLGSDSTSSILGILYAEDMSLKAGFDLFSKFN